MTEYGGLAPTHDDAGSNLIPRRQRAQAMTLGFAALFGTTVISIAFVFGRLPVWYLANFTQVDPWVYWGTAEIPDYIGKYFSSTYYFRRWTLNFPNQLAQDLLSPIDSQTVLRTLILGCVLLLAGLLTWRMTHRVVIGATAIGTLACCDFVVQGVGVSYHQGTGLMLVLGLLLLMTLQPTSRRWVLALNFAWGVTFGLCLVTYQFLLFLLPAFVLFRLASNSTRVRTRPAGLIRTAFFTFAGTLAVVLVDLAIGRVYGGWDDLISYSIGVGRQVAASGDYGVEASTFWRTQAFAPTSYALLLAVFAIAFIVQRAGWSRRWNSSRGLALAAAYSSALYFLSPQLGTNISSHPHTAIYGAVLCILLLPVTAAMAAPSAWGALTGKRLSTKFNRASTLAVPAVALLTAVLPTSQLSFRTGVAIFCLGATLSAVTQWKRFPSIRPSVAAVILILVLAAGYLAVYTVGWARTPIPPDFSSRPQAASAMDQLSREIQQAAHLADAASRRLWLVDARPHGIRSATISAFYGGYSALALDYPVEGLRCPAVDLAASTPNSTIGVYGLGGMTAAMEFLRPRLAACGDYGVKPRVYFSDTDSAWIDLTEGGAPGAADTLVP